MSEKKLLVKWEQNYGRMGNLDALFIVTEQEYKDMEYLPVWLGEALGKHSGIEADLGNMRVMTDDQDFIEKLQKYVCPVDYQEYVSGVDILCHWREQYGED